MKIPINIVILTTRGGQGLIAGSEGLQEAFKKKYGQKCSISVIDFFEHGSLIGYLLTEFYNFLLRHSLLLSSIYIKSVNRLRPDKSALLKFASRKHILDIVKEYKPSIIIVTSQYLISFVGSVSNVLPSNIRIYASNIDPGSKCIPLWFDHNIGMHILPTEDTKDAYIKYGFPERKALTAAMVVRQRFIEIMKYDKNEIRNKLGIPFDRFVVLLTGSREGYSGMINISELLLKNKNIYLIAVAGTNKELKQKLEKLSKKSDSLKVIGWTNEPEKLMRISDVMISKPGKQTMKESITTNIPLISITYPRVMEQESSNIEFMKSRKICFEAKSATDIVNFVMSLKEDKAYYKQIQERIKFIAENEIDPIKAVTSIWEDYQQNIAD